MSEAPEGHDADGLRRFLFENVPLRGFWLRLERSWSAALEHQSYPDPVRRLLGESLGAVALSPTVASAAGHGGHGGGHGGWQVQHHGGRRHRQR